MKLIEKMAEGHATSIRNPYANQFAHESAVQGYIAGFRAAREMCAQTCESLRNQPGMHVLPLNGWDAAYNDAAVAIRQLGEAEEGNPTRADTPPCGS